ncbi:hypothetical protein HRM2_32860 [Desulforapulum autotrophicum HRM2]|uniref:Uncharacterized protein n=1 Tax=Desulforapulum autotrophicum (strain ATCC 43914 / DSM 3382 / VKM B-1955 / HRM2) TaxID=177437 RepID=C0QLQ9_DESAH|nr:hypothetical protein HRM2_32860 [Desulforapulum autotrophicum HRM2]
MANRLICGTLKWECSIFDGSKSVMAVMGLWFVNYLVFERKLTHLPRCCINLKSSCTPVHSGFSFACALHMGKFLSKHRFSFKHYLVVESKKPPAILQSAAADWF